MPDAPSMLETISEPESNTQTSLIHRKIELQRVKLISSANGLQYGTSWYPLEVGMNSVARQISPLLPHRYMH